MIELAREIRRLGGLAATFELYETGATRAELSAAAASGRIIRARQGWYALPSTEPRTLAAVRVGGRLACSSALHASGGWAPRDDPLHVEVAANACRLRSPRSKVHRLAASEEVIVHWTDADDPARLRAPIVVAMSSAIRCLPVEHAAAAIDSILRLRPSVAGAWSRILADAPARTRRQLARLDGICESGAETLAWFALLRAAPSVQIRRQCRSQVSGGSTSWSETA